MLPASPTAAQLVAIRGRLAPPLSLARTGSSHSIRMGGLPIISFAADLESQAVSIRAGLTAAEALHVWTQGGQHGLWVARIVELRAESVGQHHVHVGHVRGRQGIEQRAVRLERAGVHEIVEHVAG